MKTFFEHLLDEIARLQKAGKIDEEKARCWIEDIKKQLDEYAKTHPDAPIVQMPVTH